MKLFYGRGVWLMIAAAAAVGCFGPKYEDCHHRCGSAEECPKGLSCVRGFCTSSMICDVDAAVIDASDATDGDNPDVPDGGSPEGGETKPPWTPAAIPGLVLWLEGDRGIDAAPDAKVWTWRDQSGMGNDANQHTETYTPKLTTTAINDLPAVEFAFNTWLFIKDHASLRWGFEDFAVFVLYRSKSRCLRPDCIVQALYRKQELPHPWIGAGLGIEPDGRLQLRISDGADQYLVSPATDYDDGAVHLLGGLRRKFRPALRIDGVEHLGPVPRVVLDLDATGQNVYFGAHGMLTPPSEYSFPGYIAAIVAVKGPISDADLAGLESYLMTKYGVAP